MGARRICRLKSVRLLLLVGGVAGIALCFSAVLGAPSIESALVLGLLLPPFVAAAAVRLVFSARELLPEGESPSVATVFGDALSLSLVACLVPSALLGLNLLRVPVCDPLEGVVFLLLGPFFACALAAIVGALIGLGSRRPRWATAFAALVPVFAILAGLYRFWDTPAVFAYGHFVGYFPGTLYDPDITVRAPYVSFRAVTAIFALGLFAVGVALGDDETLTFRWTGRRKRLLAAGAALLFGSLIGDARGLELGHRSSSAHIEQVLGGRAEGERCVAIVPRELPRRDAERVAMDCDQRVRQAERVIGVRQPRTIRAFFFRSADEKRALMGAASTYVAKPWRHEVYLQLRPFPHPVLYHEIAHVVAGNVGRGPFRIAGRFGGFLPSPGLIEGLAVAVAWDERDGLTPHQWAKAMLELELAPSLAEIEGLGFLLEPASRAYVASGSFLRWVRDTHGARALRRLYLGQTFEEVLGRSVPELEREWQAFLREEVELPEAGQALAASRFERPGIFAQTCPHRVANLRVELASDLAAGDDEAAVETCGQILALDEGHAAIRAHLVGALARLGRVEEARGELARLEGPPSAPRPTVAAARLAYADARWAAGAREEAAAVFEALRSEPQSEDSLRQLDARVEALSMVGEGELALRSLLAPPRDRADDGAVAMLHLATLGRHRDDGFAAYLEARQLVGRQRFDLALPRIEAARRLGLPSARMEIEARRMHAIAHFAEGERAASERIFHQILRDPEASEAMRVEARDWLTR